MEVIGNWMKMTGTNSLQAEIFTFLSPVSRCLIVKRLRQGLRTLPGTACALHANDMTGFLREFLSGIMLGLNSPLCSLSDVVIGHQVTPPCLIISRASLKIPPSSRLSTNAFQVYRNGMQAALSATSMKNYLYSRDTLVPSKATM